MIFNTKEKNITGKMNAPERLTAVRNNAFPA
jgi:hypothetical protein